MCSNANTSKTKSEQTGAKARNDTYPCVSFFIAYEPNEQCDDDTFFAALHNQDVEPEINPIRVRNRASQDMETAARQLFQTVKDHDNASMQEMVDVSNTYCYQNAPDSQSESENEDEEEYDEFQPTHFPTVPCCLVIVSHGGYVQQFENAVRKLQSDGLVFDTTLDAQCDKAPSPTPSNDLIATIRKIQRIMDLSKHALYRGQIYARPNGAKVTYIRLMDVSSYLNKLLANDAINDSLAKNFHTIERFLSHPACEIVPQIQFDFNLIEVSNGFCFSISKRAFVANPINESMSGKLSPRAYVPYDCSSQPQPKYFRRAIHNSFPEEQVRLNFLNKFYQCFLAYKIPQKTRKLVVTGPRDSGKTSWASIFRRIIPEEYIASITNERQFSASMITNDTQLVLIDEWSTNTMTSDLAKTVLQGGWMVTAVKHSQPRCLNYHSPFYITTNNVPDFGTENENVERRIHIFTTSSLPTPTSGIDQWLFDNAMHCIAWMADEINSHRTLIPAAELWYEDDDNVNKMVPSQNIAVQWKRSEILQITEADLDPERQDQNTQLSDDTIHSGFIAEAKSRRLARKRRRRRQLSDSSSAEDLRENVDDQIETSASQTGEIPVSQTRKIPASQTRETPEPQVNEEPHDPEVSEASDETEMSAQIPLNNEPSTSTGITHPLQQSQETDDTAERSTLNDRAYMAKVADLITSNFHKHLQKGHVHGFTERVRQATLEQNKNETVFWTTADPDIDAWMLATGRKREVFDVDAFVAHHPNILLELQPLRKLLNVKVFPDRCPVTLALQRKSNPNSHEEGSEDAPQLSSQTFWTTIKNWWR